MKKIFTGMLLAGMMAAAFFVKCLETVQFLKERRKGNVDFSQSQCYDNFKELVRMYIEEVDKYKVACHINRRDLKENGATLDDLVNRTPLGMMLIKKAAQIAKEGTDYEWPGSAFSTEMEFYPDDIVLIFSERIDDYVCSLRQMTMALPPEQSEHMKRIMEMISLSDEENARAFIREFEQNVRDAKEIS